ncbi:hypothetical protein K435DRAFT_821527 [Dendrothele bispora CBS 962.96]|uniref:CxC1-like cysteine cluster associated with KDZ transposases domain-containing protein n=1 Tax=Dendrothele bispora (strain CBS 962.96) TaxID=1314807 RepID=A0A4S8LIE1_DENBC|nr:hypothetical protein K435DRAFT_821527 [Dendrothele bispora CBS 962.96]
MERQVAAQRDYGSIHPASLVGQGLFPCSPSKPSVVVTARTLEYYRVLFLRCPRLSIQPFVKTLCDIHGVPYRSYLGQQFSICFDLYLDVLSRIKTRVKKVLGRNGSNWRLENACPACEYNLEGEKELKFKMMCCMDGNDSLKRVHRKGARVDEGGNEVPGCGPSRERMDSRTGGGDYYLMREEVDAFSKALSQDIVDELSEKDTPCSPRWKNMNDKATASMWGVFDETGVFLCLCRHGFVLLIADMVKSGEQTRAKYALAIVDRLIDTLGERLAVGYDIGCGFKTTVSKSAIGPKAREKQYTSLVGTFHGHAHCRLCQTDHLGTYVEGNGLEDSEGCERFFSKSNTLASSVRHASIFHRRQAIAAFAEHMDDFETYAQLTTFLLNNYKQALKICSGYTLLLHDMRGLGIDRESRFLEWLAEEKAYLTGLKRQPTEETLQMEYYQSLVGLEKADFELQQATKAWVAERPAGVPLNVAAGTTRGLETKRRHALETREDLRTQCQLLEQKLGVARQWMPGSPEWEDAKKRVELAQYQKCVDKLESLVVARLFELTRMNMSQTGYKLRKHIGKALQARSQAIRTALTNFNAAAAALKPPRRQLDWEQVVECTFLADFDLLRDVRQDVRGKRWAEPHVRMVMDRYFKIVRAREEIERLNVEIRRVATYLDDEDHLLLTKAEELAPTDPDLAHQVLVYHRRRERFYDLHWKRLHEIAKLPGFSGTLRPGTGKLSRKDGQEHSEDEATNVEEEEANEDFEEAESIMRVALDTQNMDSFNVP